VNEIRGIEEPQMAPMPAASLPAPASMGSRGTILLTALELRLAEGVIDLVEFQAKRDKLPAD
jgi:hypothetical protein